MDSVIKRGPGRPRDPDAYTNAERQQRWRDKQKRMKRNGIPEAIYRGPGGQTWTGRGLMPRWLANLVEAGFPKSLYLVKR